MNNSLLAQAHKALKGDLSNTFNFDLEIDLFLFLNIESGEYVCSYSSDYSKEHDQYICTVEQFNNYKEEGMNKTVRDAVIEFKAEWKNAEYDDVDVLFIFASRGEGTTWTKGKLVGDSENHTPSAFYEVCNKKQFNIYVDSLSHNAGKELFQQYLAADKTLLEKECKSMDIDWSKASDDCLGAVQHKDGRLDYKYGVFVTKTKGFMCDDYHYCGNTSAGPVMEFFDFIPRPQPKPVFTQEMCDNGELPSVGMECQTSTGILTVKYVGKKVVVSEDSSGEEFMTSKKSALHSFKPLTPPVELIDGKAYQFYGTDNKKKLGFYDEKRNSFINNDYSWRAVAVTSIKPLVVDES